MALCTAHRQSPSRVSGSVYADLKAENHTLFIVGVVIASIAVPELIGEAKLGIFGARLWSGEGRRSAPKVVPRPHVRLPFGRGTAIVGHDRLDEFLVV